MNSCNYDDNLSIANYSIIVRRSKVMASLLDSFLAEKFKEPRARGCPVPSREEQQVQMGVHVLSTQVLSVVVVVLIAGFQVFATPLTVHH